MTRLLPYGAAPPATAPAGMGIAGAVTTGLGLIALFFGGFGAWAALAPLESAAIAPGEVVVHGQRKTIQHLEGGIIRDILVENGSRVRAGQPLVRLDETQTRAEIDRLLARFRAALALEARLLAERDGLDRLVFPEELRTAADRAEVRAMLTGQEAIFRARRDALDGQTAIGRRRIVQIEAEIAGLTDEIAAETRQIDLIQEEIDAVQAMLAKGLERRPRLLELQRELAQIEGGRASNQAAIAKARQTIAETELQIVELRTDRINEVVKELRDAQADLQDLREQLRAARDVLARSVIVAPVAGRVVELRMFTRGGVIKPGEPILDLVPSDDQLVIDVRVDPADIDVVRPGLEAEVRLTAYNQRTLPIILGDVAQVSADRLTDSKTGAAYYQARVVLRGGADQLPPGITLYPGMPVETFIVTGARTPLDYLLTPITRSMTRSLIEG